MPRSRKAKAAPRKAAPTAKEKKMQEELDVMHQEMELASYARGKSGQRRKVVPKNQEMERTHKRKLLEKADEHDLAIEVEETDQKRLRGSMIAVEDEVVQGSAVFRPSRRRTRSGTKRPRYKEASDEDEQSSTEQADKEEDASDGEEDAVEEEGDDDEDEIDDVLDAEDEDEDDDMENDAVGDGRAKTKTKRGKARRGRPNKRRMYRLKNFTSQKMAKRHGDAISAHARGEPLRAIELLKEVARDAPSAPQIYSSLGMVYQSMLQENQESRQTETSEKETESAPSMESININDLPEKVPDKSIAEQLVLAKKAYGSYHVAAILCKKDFVLWVRAAEAGSEAAKLHGEALALPELPPELVSYHRLERKRWFTEVMRDYHVADNLKPPGIEVPAKLASIHMELGSLGEALTLLTDLKNRNEEDSGGRSEFQRSYKAWLLYADLMLRIGHECLQWNRGIQTNDNYMFRRWLRKYSTDFDWQERRLQALCLALEAAAGTKSTRVFIDWMRQHVMEKSQRGNEKLQGQDSDGPGADQSQSAEESRPEDSLLVEKRIMLESQRQELEDFDKTTADMELAESSTATQDLKDSRDELIKAHKEAIDALQREHESNGKDAAPKRAGTPNEMKEDEMIQDYQDSLPISASCRQVCNIASELMKHLHGLELFTGAKLVGECVSHYFKERAAKYDKRMLTVRRRDEWQERASKDPFLFETYDEVNDEISSDEEEAIAFLSDDEDLDNKEAQGLLESLRNGVLPEELKVLYGLSLVGEGGKDFLASKCLEAIEVLEPESAGWLKEGERETERTGLPFWYLFRRAMTEPLGRTTAYGFVADVLRKTGKERDWARHFLPMFTRHIESLKSVGLLEQLLSLGEKVSPFFNFRKNQLLKVMIASYGFDVAVITSNSEKKLFQSEHVEISMDERIERGMSVLSSVSEVMGLVWKVEKDGSLPSNCLEIVSVLAQLFNWFSGEARTHLLHPQLKKIIEQSGRIFNYLSGSNRGQSLFDSFEGVDLRGTVWETLPMKSSWQAPACRRVSLRAHNLTASCNVSFFSGWESEEFRLKLLRRRKDTKHYGVHIINDRATGYLPKSTQQDIIAQWGAVKAAIPNFPDLGFDKKLHATQELAWYKDEVQDREEKLNGVSIAQYRENDAEELYLSFSSLCLQLASLEKDTDLEKKLLNVSLSILLPISDYLSADRLWTSDIGEATHSLSHFDEWKLMGQGSESILDARLGKPTRKRKMNKVIEKRVQEWIQGTTTPTLKTYVSIPISVMRRSWNRDSEQPSNEDKANALMVMSKVHEATLQLRQCYTIVAIEKGSLSLASSLLELAALPGCQDPFTCLQQAAMFASQASKAGNSDLVFRHSTPEKRECTPLEALVILGRADCLHSVYFPNEAAYLCSYVASVCRLHRELEEFEWNGQWALVAIYAFNVSVMIRATVKTMLDKQMQRKFLSIWDRSAVVELERGRIDGWKWKRNLKDGDPNIPLDGANDLSNDPMNSELNLEMENDYDEGSQDGDDGDLSDDENMDTHSKENGILRPRQVTFATGDNPFGPLQIGSQDETIGSTGLTNDTTNLVVQNDDDSFSGIAMVAI